MKKLMILSAAAMAIFFAMPQFAEASTTQNNITLTQQKAVKYTEITAATLPEAITATLTKDFVGYSVDKIFQGDNDTYKVAVRKAEVKTTLIFTSKGELIK